MDEGGTLTTLKFQVPYWAFATFESVTIDDAKVMLMNISSYWKFHFMREDMAHIGQLRQYSMFHIIM